MYNSLIVSKVNVKIQGVFGETIHLDVDPDCTIGEIRDYLCHRSNTYVDELITHNGVAISDNARIINFYPRIFKLQPKEKIVLRDAEDYIASESRADASHNKSFRTQRSYSHQNETNDVSQEEQQELTKQPVQTFDTEDKLYSCLEYAPMTDMHQNSKSNNIDLANKEKQIENQCLSDSNEMLSEVNKETKLPSKIATDKRQEELQRAQKLKPPKKRPISHATKQFYPKQDSLQNNANAKKNYMTSTKSHNESKLTSATNKEKIEESVVEERMFSQDTPECESLPVSEIKLTCKIPSHNTTQVVSGNTSWKFSDVLCKLHELESSIDISNAKIVYKDKVYDQDNKSSLFNLGIRTDAVISVATENFSDPSMCILLDLEEEYKTISDYITCTSTEKGKKEAYENLMKILLRTDALQSLSGEWKERRKCLVKEITKLQDSLGVQKNEY